MPIELLTHKLVFPPVTRAEPDGLLAIGGDLSVDRLLLAYQSGIFPWYNDDFPILWYAPNPRMLLHTSALRINRSLRKAIRREPYELRLDTAFDQVLDACAAIPRPGQDGTWITDDMCNAYKDLHRAGFAHSAEAWLDGQLVGGVYGVCIGGIFCGESMFAHAPNASKIAFVALIQQLQRWDIHVIDCQVHTDHLEHFGAELHPRSKFMAILHKVLDAPTRSGTWCFDPNFAIDPASANS